jgi:hypothetical protein
MEQGESFPLLRLVGSAHPAFLHATIDDHNKEQDSSPPQTQLISTQHQPPSLAQPGPTPRAAEISYWYNGGLPIHRAIKGLAIPLPRDSFIIMLDADLVAKTNLPQYDQTLD